MILLKVNKVKLLPHVAFHIPNLCLSTARCIAYFNRLKAISISCNWT